MEDGQQWRFALGSNVVQSLEDHLEWTVTERFRASDMPQQVKVLANRT